jgi:hypothetical protein
VLILLGQVRLKRECMEAPEQLAANGHLPPALLRISNHLAGLAFEAAPDYGLLRDCLQEMASNGTFQARRPLQPHDNDLQSEHGKRSYHTIGRVTVESDFPWLVLSRSDELCGTHINRPLSPPPPPSPLSRASCRHARPPTLDNLAGLRQPRVPAPETLLSYKGGPLIGSYRFCVFKNFIYTFDGPYATRSFN